MFSQLMLVALPQFLGFLEQFYISLGYFKSLQLLHALFQTLRRLITGLGLCDGLESSVDVVLLRGERLGLLSSGFGMVIRGLCCI
jgi:hypothetical protein